MPAVETRSLWPAEIIPPVEFDQLWEHIRPAFTERMRTHRIDENSTARLAAVYLPLAAWVRRQKAADTLVLGVNGAQGSGKSTLCDFLQLVLATGFGFRVA